MTIARPAYNELLARIWNSLRQNLGITANIDDSVMGMIAKVCATEMDLAWAEIERIANNSSISTMTGAALDNFGLDLGLPRRQAQQATSTGGPRPVRFTNTGGSTVQIPTGTRVFSTTNPQFAYLTTEGLTLAAGASDSVHVTAADYGAVYNVGIGQLNAHNVPSVSVTVTNILPISNGNFLESDDSYRNRISQEFRRRKVLNVENTVALMRHVPGVKDAILINLARGGGTFDMIIVPENVNDTSAVLSDCSRLLTVNVNAGIKWKVRAPRNRYLDVTAVVVFAPGTGDRKEVVRESIRQQIRARIDTLPVETGDGRGTVNLGQIRAAVLVADGSVQDAIVSFELDGALASSEGTVSLSLGERLVLRRLEIS
jgi:uncharacterized phage protein gp47/JayE